MKRTWMLLAIMVSFLAGCKRNATPENALFVSGRIDGDTVDISSKIQGRVVDLKVREGDSVEAGQVIAWLESAQQDAIRDAQKARIVSGQRTVDEYKHLFDVTRFSLTRVSPTAGAFSIVEASPV